MYTRKLCNFYRILLNNSNRKFHNGVPVREKFENPIYRTLKILNNDIQSIKKSFDNSDVYSNELDVSCPKHVDVVIIGGGAIGSSIAYWLKEKTGNGLSVAVIEKDRTVGVLFNIYIYIYN